MLACHGTRGQLFTGLFMIAIGVLFLLDQFDVLSFSEAVRHFWPLLLIAMGVSRLIGQSGSRRIGEGQ